MMHGFTRQWRTMVWTAPMLGLLLCAGHALSAEPTVTKDGPQSGNQPSTNEEFDSHTPTNVIRTLPAIDPDFISPGQSVRQITMNPNKLRQVTGPVVKQSGMMLYVHDVTGPVVPIDMTNLNIYKMPKKGQQVLALYQVQETTNVALSVQGEKQP